MSAILFILRAICSLAACCWLLAEFREVTVAVLSSADSEFEESLLKLS